MSGITATTVLAAAAVASAGVAAAGAYSQSQSQQASFEAQGNAAKYNAAIANNNSIVAGYNARSAGEQSNAREEAQRRAFNAMQGQANAGVAQSGTGFGGTNADVLKQNAINNELDALNIRYEGQQTQAGLVNTANNYKAQGQLDLYSGSVANMNKGSAATAGYFNMGSALLSGASNAYMANKGIGAYKTT